MTRPEPTIYGNCDSWDFIVGKNAFNAIPEFDCMGSLQVNNMDFIHSLYTDDVFK